MSTSNKVAYHYNENVFFEGPQTEGLFEMSMKANCDAANCLQDRLNGHSSDELKKNINCSNAQNNRFIRNVDHEIPMLFPEYRFKHLNYCKHVNINGYIVCGKCHNCGFNSNIKTDHASVQKMNEKRCKQIN
jgi:hypothetical protein